MAAEVHPLVLSVEHEDVAQIAHASHGKRLQIVAQRLPALHFRAWDVGTETVEKT